MNKQELINKAVEDLKGVTPEHERLFVTCYGDYSSMPFGYKPILQNEYICTKDEFTQRARELGWINGYKYGVEYETNGKKPDLVGQVIIEPFYRGEWQCRARVDELNWDFDNMGYDYPVTKFRIVDQRFKPDNAEMSKSEPKMSKECLNEFPPVGAVVEYKISERCKSHVEITGHGKHGILIRTMPEGRDETYHNWNAEKNRFSPIKSEREKFVEAACEIICGNEGALQIANDMYDSGCRFTENK